MAPATIEMPAWAKDDPEVQAIFAKVREEFPFMSDECIWQALTVATPSH